MDFKPQIDFSPGSIARQKIRKEFALPRWEPFREWFFNNFHKEEQIQLQEEFYDKCLETNNILFFVPWFMSTYVDQYISVLERNYKLMNGECSTSAYPPQQPFQIEKEGKICNFLAYSKLFENDTLQITCKQINTLIEQNNYTNYFLNTLGEQIILLHDRVESIISLINDKHYKEKTFQNSIATPSIQPPPEIKDFKLKSTSELEKILENKFGKI